jgi:serine/threonine-protein kinase
VVSDDNKPARADVKPGDRVAGYLLEEQIGQGGMAVVYRAHDERLDRRVALKVLAPSLAADNAFRTRFIRESRAAATVEHPHIIPVYDAGDAGGCLFISMRYVQGGDVRSLLADGKALPPARAWNIITQVASALDMAHTHNLVHRDVKPANMLIDGSAKTGPAWGDDPQQSPGAKQDVNTSGPVTEHIYLSDFGISKQAVASNLTSTGQFVGTLDYIAPEQIEGRGIDGHADQYSLACATYELLCGVPPFTGPNIFVLINSHLSQQPPSARKVQPELSPGVDRVLAKAMDKIPAGRYASCAEFAADLGRALGLTPGALEVDGAPTLVPAEAGGSQPQHYQATELAAPALAAAEAGAAAAAAGAAQAAPVAQAAPDAPMTPPAPVTGGVGAVDAGAGTQGVTDQQTMTAGQQIAPANQWPVRPGPSARPWPAGPGQAGPYDQYQPYQTYPQPGGSGPGDPSPHRTGGGAAAWPQFVPQQQPARRSRGPLIGAIIGVVAVIAAAAVVAITVLNKSSGSPGPAASSPGRGTTSPNSAPATARSQASAINTLLMNSAHSRSRWNSNVLVSNVGQCINIDSDVSQIQQITDQRTSEYNQATALLADMIPNGATLKSQLMTALKISLRIDNDYLAWAQQQQSSGCSVGTNSKYYQQATSLDSQATTDKEIFVGTWNPIATKYGLTQFSAGQI